MIRSWISWLSKAQTIYHTRRKSSCYRMDGNNKLFSRRAFSGQHDANFYCRNCSQPFAKWQGQCPACESWGQISERKLLSSDSSNGIAFGYRQPNAHTYNKTAKGIIQAAAKDSISWSGHLKASTQTKLTQPIKMVHVEDSTLLDERIALENKELVGISHSATVFCLFYVSRIGYLEVVWSKDP